jgi:hypothetical protein
VVYETMIFFLEETLPDCPLWKTFEDSFNQKVLSSNKHNSMHKWHTNLCDKPPWCEDIKSQVWTYGFTMSRLIRESSPEHLESTAHFSLLPTDNNNHYHYHNGKRQNYNMTNIS